MCRVLKACSEIYGTGVGLNIKFSVAAPTLAAQRNSIHSLILRPTVDLLVSDPHGIAPISVGVHTYVLVVVIMALEAWMELLADDRAPAMALGLALAWAVFVSSVYLLMGIVRAKRIPVLDVDVSEGARRAASNGSGMAIPPAIRQRSLRRPGVYSGEGPEADRRKVPAWFHLARRSDPLL